MPNAEGNCHQKGGAALGAGLGSDGEAGSIVQIGRMWLDQNYLFTHQRRGTFRRQCYARHRLGSACRCHFCLASSNSMVDRPSERGLSESPSLFTITPQLMRLISSRLGLSG